MTIRGDQLVIVDVESTCWEGAIPSGEQNEIIEIGVCLLNLKTMERTDKRSILVKPQRSKVSVFCTQLTTLTQEMVDTGVSFAEACAILVSDYQTQSRAWASWGNYDRKMFEQQCDSFDVSYPFSEHHLNAKKLFANLERNDKQTGMNGALIQVNIPLEGTHHRGGDDAWNIGRLMIYLLESHGRDILLSLWI